jgi:hypothetical protein
MPSDEFLEGGSATLLWEGTLAYQAVTQAASSCDRSAATSEEPGKVLALPLIATSLVPLLSTYITHGRFWIILRHNLTHRTRASNSASKITVDFWGYPRERKSSSVKDIDKAANCFPVETHKTPPRPHGHFASSGLKLASVKSNDGRSQWAVISRGLAATRLPRKAFKHAFAWLERLPSFSP